MRPSLSQRQRSKDTPLDLGRFSQTSLRYLTGTLGPQNQVVRGGYGGGTYNHWFKITLEVNAWIITAKGGPRPNYIEVRAYDLNQNPIQARGIFDQDSYTETIEDVVYYPYVGHVINAQSAFYNNFNSKETNKGDNRYFVLPPGSYLLCVSTTRNEPLDYSLGLVIEVEDEEPKLILEMGGSNFFTYENTLEEDFILFDTTENYTGLDIHIHSLADWTLAWLRDHQQDDRFPALFLSLISAV